MSINDKISYLKATKQAIKDAIEEKGVVVEDDATFREYADRISEISGGGEGMSPSDCADLNLYLAGDWNGHVVADVDDLTMPYCFANRQLKSFYSDSNSDAQSIAPYFFAYCRQLESVSFPKLKTINEGAFYYCSALESIDMPEVLNIGESAFRGCSSLTHIELPSAATIEANAFSYCSGIEEISFPAVKSTTIGASFSRMGGLKKAVFSGITSHFGYTGQTTSLFAYCPNLKVVDVGEGVTSVRYLTYYTTDPSTGRIENLIVRNTTPPSLYNYACMSSVTNIYVPDEAVDAYKAATNWSNTAVVSKIKPLSEYVEEV